MIAIFALILAATNFLLIYGLSKWDSEQDRRITCLENQKPVKHEPKAPERVQPKQIFEKPVVKNAKEVKPLEIGDGRMRFDEEAQIAEWV